MLEHCRYTTLCQKKTVTVGINGLTVTLGISQPGESFLHEEIKASSLFTVYVH